MHEMQAIVTDVRGVSLSVCLSVMWSTRRHVQCVWGHSVQTLSNHFGLFFLYFVLRSAMMQMRMSALLRTCVGTDSVSTLTAASSVCVKLASPCQRRASSAKVLDTHNNIHATLFLLKCKLLSCFSVLNSLTKPGTPQPPQPHLITDDGLELEREH